MSGPRPKPRTVAEVKAVLAGAPNPPEKTRPIHIVLVAGPKDHGVGEHDYPAWQKIWPNCWRRPTASKSPRPGNGRPRDEFEQADVDRLLPARRLERPTGRRHRRVPRARRRARVYPLGARRRRRTARNSPSASASQKTRASPSATAPLDAEFNRDNTEPDHPQLRAT